MSESSCQKRDTVSSSSLTYRLLWDLWQTTPLCHSELCLLRSWIFLAHWESRDFRAGKFLKEQLPHFTWVNRAPEGTPLPMDTWPARSLSSSTHQPPPPPHSEVECGLFLVKDREAFEGSTLHPGLFRETEVQNVQAAANAQEPKPYLYLTGGFSTTRQPANGNSRGPSNGNIPLQPPNKSPFFFWSLSTPSFSSSDTQDPLWKQWPCSQGLGT